MEIESAIKKVVEHLDFCYECKGHTKMRYEYEPQFGNFLIICNNLNHTVMQIPDSTKGV